MSVHALLTSPLARGLFRGAVIQSGGPMAMGDATLAGAQAASLAFARSKHIADHDPEAIAKTTRAACPIRSSTASTLPACSRRARGRKPIAAPSSMAGSRSIRSPLIRRGGFAKVPVMVGATSDDIGGADGPMITGARPHCRRAGGAGRAGLSLPASAMSQARRAPRRPGARGHATDIPFFFDTATIKYGAQTTPTDCAAARIASGYLANFVKTGDPNGPTLPQWPRYTSANHAMLDLTPQGGANGRARVGHITLSSVIGRSRMRRPVAL